MNRPTPKRIVLLNQTALDSMMEKDSMTIIKNFTEVGIKIFDADFGFAWWRFHDDEEYKLAYKSSSTPYEPTIPRESAGNYVARTTKKPFFDSQVKKENYEYDISRYLKSYIIIPIYYKDLIYGSLVLCYKGEHSFSEDDVDLATVLGTTTAQAITIHRLVLNEQKARILSESQEAHFRALTENSYEVITLINEKGKILYVSYSVAKVLGIEPKDVMGKNISDFIYNKDGSETGNYIKKILKNPNTNHVIEFQYEKKDGTVLFLESTSTNMTKNPDVGGIVINIRDITERKNLELVKETKRLLEEEKMKIESVADATHELRTPLAIIKGNIDLALLDAGLNKRRYADKALINIDKEINHLSNIVSDLALITSNRNQYRSKMNYGKVNISELIDQIVKRYRTIARKKNISISAKMSKDIGLVGDKVYLEKLFSNLVRNAITYGKEKGWIKVSVVKKASFIEIKVIDNGAGISGEDLPYIFNRFYRADKSHNSDGKRAGLGLAIAKWVAEVHGATISVQSTLGKGSVFMVELPLKTTIVG